MDMKLAGRADIDRVVECNFGAAGKCCSMSVLESALAAEREKVRKLREIGAELVDLWNKVVVSNVAPGYHGFATQMALLDYTLSETAPKEEGHD